jgi:hypothetical protein
MSGLSPAAALAAGSFAAVILLAVVVVPALRNAFGGPPVGVAIPTPEGAVAGGRSSQPPTPRPSAVHPMNASFDELVIGAAIPADWRIDGDPANVTVAPFPNAVDRSLRLVSAADGAPTGVCRSLRGLVSRISFDLLSPQPTGLTVTLRDPTTGTERGLKVEADGDVQLRPADASLPGWTFRPDAWSGVSFEADAAGGLSVSIGPIDGALSGASGHLDWSGTPDSTDLCFTSPPRRAAELYLDNVAIE